MTQKTLVLHIGMPKTGTTSIQETFGAQRKKLRRVGICYPAQKPYNHSNTFAPIFQGTRLSSIYFKQLRINTEQKAEQKVKELKQYWQKQFQKSNESTFILSAETLYRSKREEIAALKAFVEPYFSQFKIIVYVRPPVAALRSLWGQHVKTLSRNLTQQQLLQAVMQGYNYAFVDDWAAAFGKENIVVRPFVKKAFYNGNLLDDFLISIGGEAGVFQQDAIQNEAFGKHTLALIYESNLRFPLFVHSTPNPEKGLSDKMRIFFDLLQRVEDEKFDAIIHFNAEQAKKLNTEIDIINGYLPLDQQFEHVQSSETPTDFPSFEDIPKEYMISVINEYNKYIDQLIEVNLHPQVELLNPTAGKYVRKFSRLVRHVLGRFGIMPN